MLVLKSASNCRRLLPEPGPLDKFDEAPGDTLKVELFRVLGRLIEVIILLSVDLDRCNDRDGTLGSVTRLWKPPGFGRREASLVDMLLLWIG